MPTRNYRTFPAPLKKTWIPEVSPPIPSRLLLIRDTGGKLGPLVLLYPHPHPRQPLA